MNENLPDWMKFAIIEETCMNDNRVPQIKKWTDSMNSSSKNGLIKIANAVAKAV